MRWVCIIDRLADFELIEIFSFTIIAIPAVIPGTRGVARDLECWLVAVYFRSPLTH